MIIIGGFYSLIHLIIIAVGRTIRLFKMNKVLSYITIRIVLTLILFSVYTLVNSAMANSPNSILFAKVFFNCQPIEQPLKENKIILRIDDIQAYAWRDVQEKMIGDAIKDNIPPVLGVIPYGIDDDKELYNFIKKNNCKLEIAQHGYDHGAETKGIVPEFRDLNEKEAYNRIMRGKPILEKLAGRELTTFIPPNNIYSTSTGLAITRAGFKVISGDNNGPYAYTASTYDSNNEELVAIDTVVSYCQQALDKNNLCVIMAHPQDYATSGKFDEEKYAQYTALLDRLKALDAMFARPSDLVTADN